MIFFDFEYRVRYGDTDKLGVSYYANYLVWCEAARTEYFRALGLPYTECEKKGYFLPVVEAFVRYLSPSTYDDLLIVRTSVSEIRHTSMRFEYQILKEDKKTLAANAYTVHVFVDSTMKPCRVLPEVKKIVTLHKLIS
jgi:acyl-CoA thioester hydrolase